MVDATGVASALGGLVAGFSASSLQTYLADRRKRRTQWDVPVYNACADYAASARTNRDVLAHLTQRLREQAPADVTDAARNRFREVHGDFRANFERVAILGSPAVIEAARAMRRSIYALREMAMAGADRQGSEWTDCADQLVTEQRGFYHAVRLQLKVPTGAGTGDGTLP